MRGTSTFAWRRCRKCFVRQATSTSCLANGETGPLSPNTTTNADTRRHLGFKKEQSPAARGFDKVFSFLAGSGNHYNYEPQFDNPRYHLPWRNQLWMEGSEYVDRKNDIPDDFYSTTYTTEKLLRYLRERTDEQKAQPFFAYLAYLAPHWPLQAPEEVVKKYKGFYNDGPRKLAERRVRRLIELGLVPRDVVPAPMEDYADPRPWDTLTAEDQALSARKMEAYAAMVDMIDQGVGQVVDYLESTGELDNTFICFISDNGAEGVMMEALATMGELQLLTGRLDNSQANAKTVRQRRFDGRHHRSVLRQQPG